LVAVDTALEQYGGVLLWVLVLIESGEGLGHAVVADVVQAACICHWWVDIVRLNIVLVGCDKKI
jgi:hypothetical protein